MILDALLGCCLAAGPVHVQGAAAGGPAVVAPQVPGVGGTAAGQRGVPASRELGAAEAYVQFMLGRHLESEGDIDGAVAAYRAAARLDPASAEIPSELAALYAREGKAHDAIESAETALRADAKNAEAHRVLGMVYAGLAHLDSGQGALDAGSAAYAAQAIEHLEAARAQMPLPQAGLEMALARLYLRTASTDKAIAVLTRLIVDEPERSEPVSLLVEAYEQAGRDNDAASLLESIVADNPQLYAALGEVYERQQRWKNAAGAYEKAVARAPRNTDLKTRLALALLYSGDDAMTGRALTLLEQIREASPGDARILFLLAQAQRAAGKLDDSEATSRQLMAVAPGSRTGPFALALVLERKQQHQQVIDVLGPVVAREAPAGAAAPPELTPLLVHLGFAYVELGRFDEALAAFARARESAPDKVTIDIHVIQAHLAAKHFDKAIEVARQVLEARPGDQRAMRLQADALRRSGHTDEGARMLVAALDAHGNDPSAFLALAELYTQSGQYEAALRILAQAAGKFPDDLEIPFQIGSVFDRQKRFADAEREFRGVIARDPLHARTLNYLGYMLAERGDRLQEAVGYIQRALVIEPYNGAYLDSLGWAYFKQKKLDLAETSLRKAAGQLPRDSAVQDHLGDLLLALGRYQEAAAAWQRSLDGDGEQIDRTRIEQKLRSARAKGRRP